jgi:hypothetical protein
LPGLALAYLGLALAITPWCRRPMTRTGVA